MSNTDSGIEKVTYNPPSEHSDGFIAFTFDGKKLSAAIRMVDKEDAIGQWSVSEPAVIFVDKKIGIGFIKYLCEHELLERHLDKNYGIPWDPYAHSLAEEFEHREFRKSHPESEWHQYSRQVKQVSHMNEGGKVSRKVNLERAFELLADRRRQLAWSERGLNSIVQKQTNQRELTKFSRELKKAVDKKLREE
jgi:hypothetical protein